MNMNGAHKSFFYQCLRHIFVLFLVFDLLLAASYLLYTQRDVMAKMVLEQKIQIEPADTHARLKLGIKYSQLGQYDRAIEEYEKVIGLDPSNEKAHFNLGVRYFEKGLLEQAKQEFYQVLDLRPNHSGAHLGLGVVHAMKREVNEALYHYKKLKQVNPLLAIKLFDMIS